MTYILLLFALLLIGTPIAVALIAVGLSFVVFTIQMDPLDRGPSGLQPVSTVFPFGNSFFHAGCRADERSWHY